MLHDQHEEDLLINSEIIWTFENVDKELLKMYPNGKSLAEDVITIDGLYTWKVEFYPNGKDKSSEDKLYISITLVNVKTGVESDVDAECNYYLINKDKKRNYAGRIERRKFTTYLTEHDSSFENTLLKECTNNCMISLGITQFPNGPKHEQVFKTLGEVSSATPIYAAVNDANADEFDESDFQKVTVKQLL